MSPSQYQTIDNQTYLDVHGSKIAQLGLGTWCAPPGVVKEAVMTAVKLGYRHIDCADVYGNQKEVGEGFHQLFDVEKVVKREEVWITSKYFHLSTDEKAVIESVERFLKDLQLKYLDLVLIHWPQDLQLDFSKVDLMDAYKATWKAFEKCVDLGLAKNIGVSNMSVKKLSAVMEYASKPIFTNQVEMHPYWRNDKLYDFCKKHNQHITAYSVLGTPENNSSNHPELMKNDTVLALAKKYNVDVGQILIRWGIQRGTCVLAKSTKASRIESNSRVFDFELSEEDFKALSSFKMQHRYVEGRFCIGEGKPHSSMDSLWDGEL